MKKIAMLSTVLMLAVTPAFAFTNNNAGYKIANDIPNLVMQTDKMYAYANIDDFKLHMIGHFTTEEMTKVVGEKFTTAYFDDVCHKLAILKKAEAVKAISNMPIFNLDNYAKLDPSNSWMYSKGKDAISKVVPTIKFTKLAGRNAITMSLYFKQDTKALYTHITLTSANDMLYILSSSDDIQEKATAAAKDKKPTTEAPAEASGLNFKDDLKVALQDVEVVDVKSLDAKAVSGAFADHNKFTKLFQTSMPVKEAPAITYTDALSERTIEVPKGWYYGQYNHEAGKNQPTGVLTVLMPKNLIPKICDKFKSKDLLAESTADNKAAMQKLIVAALEEVEDIVVTGSYKLNNNKDVVNVLANPEEAKQHLDTILKTELPNIQKKGGEYIKLNSYKYDSKIDSQAGVLIFNTDITLLNKVDFINRLKLLGNTELAMAAWQIHNKAKNISTESNVLYENWQF